MYAFHFISFPFVLFHFLYGKSHLEVEGLHGPDKAVPSLHVLQEAHYGASGSQFFLYFPPLVQGGEWQQLPVCLQGLTGLLGL